MLPFHPNKTVNKEKAEDVRNKVSRIDKNPNAADVDERIFN